MTVTGRLTRWFLAIAVFMVTAPAIASPASANEPGNYAVGDLWSRTDRPVLNGQASRTWLWGPEAISNVIEEPSTDHARPIRHVQYFEKGRIELFAASIDGGVAQDPRVRSGLLASELIHGRIQTGAAAFEERSPASIDIAGDIGQSTGPTYATFAGLLDEPALDDNALITQRVDRDGAISDDPNLAGHDVRAAHRVTVPGLDHQIAGPFWEHMNQSGPIWESGRLVDGPLYTNPFDLIGYPITEAYWTTTVIAGVEETVLIQAFERRVLTYLPNRDPAWRVQHANIGAHYLEWRYGDGIGDVAGQDPPPALEPPGGPAPELGHLEGQLRNLLDGREGLHAVTVTDLQSGHQISINGDRPQLAACTIKIPLMVAVAQDISAGHYTAEDVEDLVLPAMGPSLTPPARELIAIVGGGDIGAGIDRINDIMWELGATGSLLTHPPGYFGEEYGYAASHGIVENHLTTDDLNRMLARLYEGDLLPPEMRDYFFWSMTIATPFLDDSMGRPLPPEATLYHKIGVLYAPNHTWNDAGIVVFERDGKPYAYALSYLSTQNPDTYLAGYDTGAEISRLVWDAFQQ